MGRDEALGQIDDYFLKGAFEADLARRIAFRTESNLEGCEDALQGYLEDELVPYLSSWILTARSIPTRAAMPAPSWPHGGRRTTCCRPS